MSITIDRAALACSLPNVSVKIAVLEAGLTLTFLDAEGEHLGVWLPQSGSVFVASREIGHASTADEAGRMLLAYEPAPKKAPKKASKKTASQTPVQATARTATPKKETAMSTTTTPRLTLASLNARIDGLDSTLDRIITMLTPAEPAKATKARKARTVEATAEVSRCTSKTAAGKRCKREGKGGLCGSHSGTATKAPKAKAPKAAPAPKASKGSRSVAGGSGLSRSAWNKTLTTKARLAGKGKGGKSVYSLVTGDWAKVQQMRAEGMTPDQALAAFTK